jgi:hypothetical protein
LSEDPQGDQLRDVMIRYHNWLKVLPSSQRTEVLGLPIEERVAKIKSLLAEQSAQRSRELALQSVSRQDLGVIFNWMLEKIKANEPKLLADLPEDQRKDIAKTENPHWRVFRLIGATIRHRHLENDPGRHERILDVTVEDRENLLSTLSPTAQETYRKAASEDERHRLFQNWTMASMMREFSRGQRRIPPGDVRRSLGALDPKLRDQLDYLPPDQLRAELERINRFGLQRYFGEGGFKGGGPSRNPGGGPRDDSRRMQGTKSEDRPGEERGERKLPGK